MSEPSHTPASLLPPELGYLAQSTASNGIMQVATSFTALNWVGVLLVYGLGLICAASVLNLQRRHEREAEEAEAVIMDAAAHARAGGRRVEDARVLLMASLEDAAETLPGGYRVTTRPDLALLGRPAGTPLRSWLRCLTALHLRTPDFALLDPRGRVVATVELLSSQAPAGSSDLRRWRHAAMKAAGLPFRVVDGSFDRNELARWVRKQVVAAA